MSASERILVSVNNDLVLDAGESEVLDGPHGRERIIRPARTPLFSQVFDYLRAMPEPRKRLTGTFSSREGVAAAAVTLRWGSYFAVLADHRKPVWSEVNSHETSRIDNDEMARINIETSAAMAEWIDICRTDAAVYRQLVDKAVSYLPMPNKASNPTANLVFAELANPAVARRLEQAVDADALPQLKSEVALHPSRVLANAVVNVAWRNGPVEDVHAGASRGYPLDKRRVAPDEERKILCFASDEMRMGMGVCHSLATERPLRPWPEQVLPYRLASMLLIAPSGWTLTGASHEIRSRLSV
ncbi:hypothetical protein JYJ95_12830 [Corallococcus exiguus]|uniref:hypothetical protein n=1 Tax=Corallococcus exiguus TaxID=83462 RepID=UPI001A8C94DD|nr:hypothetical protein [Corallococcus exiguus]MBN8467401.1 hypothetical protein [Corallococcus exiguus]